MLLKKLGALLLSLAMVVACVPGTMVAAEESAWFDLEAENGILASGGVDSTISAASNGKHIVSSTTHRNNSTTLSFSREASGVYDVWAVIGVKDVNYLGEYEFSLDGEYFYDKNMKDAYNAAVGESFYTTGHVTSGVTLEMKWVKVGSAITIGSGDHSILAAVGKEHKSNQDAVINGGNALGAIDVVRVVPTSWSWTPDGATFAAPTPVEWVNLKIKEATLSEGDFDGKHPTLAQVDEMYVAKHDKDGATADWTFEVPLTNSYDVWVLCDDFSGEHESHRFLTINSDAQIEIPKSGVLAYTSNIATGWNMGYFANYTFNLNWIKVTTKDFVAGEANTIRWSCLPRTAATDGNLTAVHSVRLVPSEWGWAPVENDATLAAPTDARPSPDENGVLHLEGEAGVLGGSMSLADNANASGGKFAKTYSSGNVGSTTLSFKVEDEGMYDIWAAVGVPSTTGTHLGGYQFTLDSDVLYKKNHSGTDRTHAAIYGGDNTIIMHTGDASGSNATVRWIRVGTRKITEGGHKIICDVIQGNPANSTGVIDCVRLVPTSWGWNAGGNFDYPTIMAPETDENGILHLETENGSVLKDIRSNAAASGGKYIHSTQNQPENASMMAFSVNESDLYDVWAVVGVKDVDFFGAYSFSLDENDPFYSKNMKSVYKETVGESFFTTDDFLSGYNAEMKWVKVGSNVIIEEGNHIMTAAVVKEYASKVEGGNAFGSIDCVRIVPSEYNWTPSGANFDYPVYSTVVTDRSFVWIEGEDLVPVNNDAQNVSVGKYVSSAESSNGKEIYRNPNGASDKDFAPEFTYSFKVDKAGEYEIWNYGMCFEGTQGTHLGKMTASVGSDTTTGASSDVVLNNNESGTGGSKRWCRLSGDITLVEGMNKLDIKYTHGGTHCLFITDAIAIVPKGWAWRPANGTNAVANAPLLDATAIGNVITSQTGSDLKADLYLPEFGAAGSAYSYVSTNPAVSNTGVVTIPTEELGDATGTIIATATKGTLSASTDAFDIFVKAVKTVEYASFAINGDVASGATLTATVTGMKKNVADAKNAVVIIAVYKDNVLVDTAFSAATTLTNEAQDITSAAVTLPADVTGYTVKAFLWNGLESGMPYASPIAK